MQRISVIGTSGAGKTTFARQISQRLSIPHIELDYLYWEPNWVAVSADIFRARLAQALSGNSWVVDGNYSQVRDIIWDRCDTVIWLDYGLLVVMNRVIRRTLHRVITQQEVCHGNRETWKTTFSKDSIILWALNTYHKRRQEFPQLLAKPEYSHLIKIHLQSPKAAENWLLSI
jgi:adenylate kinase family enzyme